MCVPAGTSERIGRTLEQVEAWDAQLHLCQSARRLRIAPETTASWRVWLLPLLTHKRPFLRAWALDAFCHLAEIDEALAEDAERWRARMADDPAASVRARARKLENPRT